MYDLRRPRTGLLPYESLALAVSCTRTRTACSNLGTRVHGMNVDDATAITRQIADMELLPEIVIDGCASIVEECPG